jgi:hypothetical protein
VEKKRIEEEEQQQQNKNMKKGNGNEVSGREIVCGVTRGTSPFPFD